MGQCQITMAYKMEGGTNENRHRKAKELQGTTTLQPDVKCSLKDSCDFFVNFCLLFSFITSTGIWSDRIKGIKL